MRWVLFVAFLATMVPVGMLAYGLFHPKPAFVEMKWAIVGSGNNWVAGTDPRYTDQQCYAEVRRILDQLPEVNLLSCDLMGRRPGSQAWIFIKRQSFGRGSIEIRYHP